MEEIDQARERLAQIEDTLRFEIQRALDGFAKQFGIPIIGVDVNLRVVESTTIGDQKKQYRYGPVSVTLTANLTAKT